MFNHGSGRFLPKQNSKMIDFQALWSGFERTGRVPQFLFCEESK
jgi:hypothetical protein